MSLEMRDIPKNTVVYIGGTLDERPAEKSVAMLVYMSISHMFPGLFYLWCQPRIAD